MTIALHSARLWCLAGLISLAITPGTIGADANGKEEALTVMSFNLRYASTNSPNSWSQRRPVMQECLQRVNPDLIGTQEGLYHQLKDVSHDLPEYDWIGMGRDGGSRGEFMAIFYRKARFEPLEFDHFWLSDTPNVVGSTTWGNRNRRMVTWIRFTDRVANQQFYFINTHLDHEIQMAREKAAALIRERIEALRTGLPLLLVGDFNAAAGTNKAYSILTENQFLTDTWTVAGERKNENIGTFHNFQGPRPAGARIDWILSRGPVRTETTEIVTCAENGQYPSDHFPLVARVRWTE